jgi:diacylglycerol kinase (ATP)
VLLASQHNAWIHLAATVLVLVAGFLAGVSAGEWIALALAIGIVWCAEGLNTAIELLGDEISMEHRERIGCAKDVAAFAVLVAASAAVVVGIVVFGRHLVPD